MEILIPSYLVGMYRFFRALYVDACSSHVKSWVPVVHVWPPHIGAPLCLLGGGGDGGPHEGVVCQPFLMGLEARFQNGVQRSLFNKGFETGLSRMMAISCFG